MRRAGSRKHGFTLIELLVVIAIIALLLAIILPSLKLAKEAAKRAVCLAHLHSLGISWITYADENDGQVIDGRTAGVSEISANPRQFRIGGNTWIGWFTEPLDSYNDPIPDKEARLACIELGTLYPYNDTHKVYRCPVGIRDELRTYAIPDAMNGDRVFGPAGKLVLKLSELRSPGTRLVFIDEGWATPSSWTIYPDRVQWWDRPPVRHGDGTTVTMADGSAEYWKWKNQKTIDFANGIGDSISTAINNVDFDKIQRAAWGKVAR